MKYLSIFSLPLFLAVISLSAYTQASVKPPQVEIQDAGDVYSAVKPYTLAMDNGDVHFYNIKPDLVAVVALATGSHEFDPLTKMDLTPYEAFVRLSGGAVDVPKFLVDHYHLMQMAVPSAIDPLDFLEAEVEPQGAPSHGYDKGLHGNVNCAFSADGALFDDFWQDNNYGWHWYYSGASKYKSSPMVKARKFRGHLCNYSVGSNKPRHRVWGSGWYISQDVPKARRSYIFVFSPNKYNLYSTRYSHYYTESGYYRLGAMAKNQ